MYKIKEKFLNQVFKYAKTNLNLRGTYSKEIWNKNGFKDNILEKVKNK